MSLVFVNKVLKSRFHVMTFTDCKGNERVVDHYEFVNWLALLQHLCTVEGGFEVSTIQLGKVLWGIRNPETRDKYVAGLLNKQQRIRVEYAYRGYQRTVVLYMILLAHEGLVQYKEVLDPTTGGAGSRFVSQITPAGREFYAKYWPLAYKLIEERPFITSKTITKGG